MLRNYFWLASCICVSIMIAAHLNFMILCHQEKESVTKSEHLMNDKEFLKAQVAGLYKQREATSFLTLVLTIALILSYLGNSF